MKYGVFLKLLSNVQLSSIVSETQAKRWLFGYLFITGIDFASTMVSFFVLFLLKLWMKHVSVVLDFIDFSEEYFMSVRPVEDANPSTIPRQVSKKEINI